ncbi:MAG: cupin [Cellulomonas sp. 73-145]|uniref:cupin domain-containing protein n=1 Tax=Cellulomonas sp. 73-145 TaxID=1895739 RepID=UPI00092BA8A9|nr:cupin domain-containing protein [Cellulomonas sp. 73-145]OJV57922.1 MAG: cupin [Cellulomonas sp. 73-145]
MPLSTLSDAPTFAADGFVFQPLAAPSRGSTEIAVWQVTGQPGARSSVHSMDREEVFVVAEGVLGATVDGAQLRAGTGDALTVPAGAVLQLWNAGDGGPVRLIACTSRGMRATVDGATFAPPWAQ